MRRGRTAGVVSFARMQGVTTALVAFIFAGVVWPHLIKHKVQFYVGFICVVFIILLDSFGRMFFDKESVVIYGITGLLQVLALVALVLSGGMTARELSGEMLNTIDVVRRGGQKETIIVPLRGEQPKSKAQRDIAAEEAALDAAEAARPAAAPAPQKAKQQGSIPME